MRGEVRLDGVSFRYDVDGPWTFRDIDLVVPPGTTTAIVGETGAGKTTLAYLAAGRYDADEATVRIDGHDVRELRLDSGSELVGLVSQETYLFHDTLGANLRFARPEATDADLDAAVRTARIDWVVDALPERYDTVVGARHDELLAPGGRYARLAGELIN